MRRRKQSPVQYNVPDFPAVLMWDEGPDGFHFSQDGGLSGALEELTNLFGPIARYYPGREKFKVGGTTWVQMLVKFRDGHTYRQLYVNAFDY